MAGPSGPVGKVFRVNGKRYATGPDQRTSGRYCPDCKMHVRGKNHENGSHHNSGGKRAVAA